MKCSKCGAEFDAKFCPECGTPAGGQPQQPIQPPVQQPLYQSPTAAPKKKMNGCLKGVLIALGIIVVLIVLVQSCSGGAKPASVVSTNSSNAGAQSTSSAAEKTVFNVGETVKYSDVELTVTKVEKTKGSEYDTPKSGNEYVIVTVKYKNDGTQNVSYNPYDFKIKNSKGQITDGTYLSTIQKNQLGSGSLAPKGEVEGKIAFEAPKNDKGLILEYTGNIFISESEIDFKLD